MEARAVALMCTGAGTIVEEFILGSIRNICQKRFVYNNIGEK